MSTDYDPKLQALFSRAVQEFDRDAFTKRVMARIDSDRRKIVVFWSVIGISALVVTALLASPLATAVGFVSNVLPASLVSVETDWLRQLLSPVNSVAAAIAVGALALRKFYRRIFR